MSHSKRVMAFSTFIFFTRQQVQYLKLTTISQNVSNDKSKGKKTSCSHHNDDICVDEVSIRDYSSKDVNPKS